MLPEQQELPDDVAIKIPLGDDEVDVLAQTLVDLAGKPEERDRREEAVRRYVDEECHWSHMAAKYAEYLAAFPRPKVGPRQIVKLRVALNKLRAREARESQN